MAKGLLGIRAAGADNRDHVPCPHFYVYDSGLRAGTGDLHWGSYHLESSGLLKQPQRGGEPSWYEAVRSAIDAMPDGKKGVLFYIHGFQADNAYFVRKSGRVIQRDILDRPGHSYGLCISLQWKSSLVYKSAVDTALAKGRDFAAIAGKVAGMVRDRWPGAPVGLLCHSMGNRVWQGMYDAWVAEDTSLGLHTVLMAAADLESDIFSHAFSGLHRRAERVVIYHNLNDKTLRMARTFMPQMRLGLTGPDHPSDLPGNFIFRDVTGLRDDESFAGKFTNHRYYSGSPTVRGEIVRFLSHQG